MSIIKHVTLQKIVAHDFRYDPCVKFRETLRPKMLRVARFGFLNAAYII